MDNLDMIWDVFDKIKKTDTKKDLNKCCSEPNLVPNKAEGYISCSNCGHVLNEVILDFSPEWKFNPEDGKNYSRCGDKINPLLPISSTASVVPGDSKMAKLSKWSSMPYNERFLWQKYKDIESAVGHLLNPNTLHASKFFFKKIRDLNVEQCPIGECLCNKNILDLDLMPCTCLRITGISHRHTSEEAVNLFTPNENYVEMFKRGMYLNAIMLYCVQLAMSKNKYQVIIPESKLKERFNVDTNHLSKVKEYMNKALNLPSETLDSENNIKTIFVKLRLDYKYIPEVQKLLQFVKKNKLLTSKTKSSILAGCIYYTILYFSLDVESKISLDDICSGCEVSKITVQKVYYELNDIIKAGLSKKKT